MPDAAGALSTAPVVTGRLLRAFGVAFGLAVIVGNTIGAGILRTPGEIAGSLPTPALFFGVWIAGALYALLGALNLAELGAMLPSSGGQYVFARHAFGRYPGFVIGWSDWLSSCASTAAVSIAIGESAIALIPSLTPYRTVVAVAPVVIFGALIWRGAKESGRTQVVTSLIKGLALIAFVAACFLMPHEGAETATVVVAPAHVALLAGLVIAMQGVIYAYDGWNGVLYFSEEVKDPGRDIPRSMLVGVLSVAAIYLLLCGAYVYVLSLPSMAGEPFVAAAAARVIFGARGYTIVNVLTIAILLSSANALLLMSSRVPVAMSRDRLFPGAASGVDARGTPVLALVASAGVSVLFVVTGAFDAVLALAAFFFVLNYVVSFSALFLLRQREPQAARPYRAWGYPWTTGLALVVSIVFLVSAVASDTQHSLWALGALAVSYPVYRGRAFRLSS